MIGSQHFSLFIFHFSFFLKEKVLYLHPQSRITNRGGDCIQAGIAQLVEHDLAKVGVASSSLVSRSIRMPRWWNGRHVGLKIQWPLWPCGFKSRPGYNKTP